MGVAPLVQPGAPPPPPLSPLPPPPPRSRFPNVAIPASLVALTRECLLSVTLRVHTYIELNCMWSRPWLGCAFRLEFRFLPVLIFRNSGYSAEFPEFRGTHVGIKSFQGKINLLQNSGSGNPDPEFRREGPSTWCILCHV